MVRRERCFLSHFHRRNVSGKQCVGHQVEEEGSRNLGATDDAVFGGHSLKTVILRLLGQTLLVSEVREFGGAMVLLQNVLRLVRGRGSALGVSRDQMSCSWDESLSWGGTSIGVFRGCLMRCVGSRCSTLRVGENQNVEKQECLCLS